METIVDDPIVPHLNHLNHLHAANATQPLLKLPAEILGLILQTFLCSLELRIDAFKPHWNCSVSDCSALIPVSHTCRRLREVVLSLPSVAKSIIIEHDMTKHYQEISQDIPLSMFISLYSNIGPSLRDFYTAELHRVQELHLTSLSHKALDFWTPLLSLPAPRLRFLSLASPRGIAWLPPNGALLPFPPQASELRYLTLNGVCFLPENHLDSLTHLALLDVHIPRTHSHLIKVLTRCPNLESLVLSNINESLPSDLTRRPKIHLPSLRRITLRKLGTRPLSFYLECLPRIPRRAYQLLDYSFDNVLNRTFIPKYSPNPRTIRFTYHPQPPQGQRDDFYSGKNSVASMTCLGSDGALHAVHPVSHPFSSVHDMLRDILGDRPSVASVREAWLVGFHPTKAIPDGVGAGNPNAPQWRSLRSPESEGHHFSVAIRETVTSLPSLDTLVHVFRRTLEPNLFILPNAQSPAFVSRDLKTLRLVVCHGLPPYDSDSERHADVLAPRPTLSLAKVREGLASEQYAYLDTLVVQIAAHVVVDDFEILEVSKYVPTVKIERIAAVPELALPAFCREPAAGSTWLGALW